MRKEIIILLETAVDHLSGEELGNAITLLNDMPETLDAIYIPAIGKKNRPTGLMQILCRPESEKTVARAVFRHTHTLGLRRQEIERYILERRPATAEIAGEAVPAKIHLVEGREYIRPEADAVSKLADRLGIGAPGLRFLNPDHKNGN